jgi:hypothetical protein
MSWKGDKSLYNTLEAARGNLSLMAILRAA